MAGFMILSYCITPLAIYLIIIFNVSENQPDGTTRKESIAHINRKIFTNALTWIYIASVMFILALAS